MEIRPAHISQVERARDGQMVVIDDDVGGVAYGLQQIDPDLSLRFSETGGYFVVYHTDKHGKEYLVLTAQECDQRIVQRVARIGHSSYDYAQELERVHDQADKAADDALHEKVGEIGERAFHAARQDLGVKDWIFVK